MMVVERATWLVPAIMSDPVLAERLVLVKNWDTAERPGDFFPSGAVNHHTACMLNVGHKPDSCINVVRTGNSIAPGPIGHALLTTTPAGVAWDGENADPRIYVHSIGRTNHAGASVYPWGAPGGNGSTIGIECCGPPVYWPDLTIEIYERFNAAILRNRHWPIERIVTHWECAIPRGRKIDDSGPYIGEPNIPRLQPWNPDIWRARIAARMEDNDMQFVPLNIRALDTRSGAPFAPGERRTITTSGLPPGSKVAFFTATVVAPPQAGYLTAWEAGDRPATSFCPYQAGVPSSAGYTNVSLSGFGTFELFAKGGGHILVDITGVMV